MTETATQASSIGLAALRERNFPLHWHEAVAIVQGVLEELAADGTGDLHDFASESAVTQDHVAITSTGAVLLLPGRRVAADPVASIRELLGALLEAGAPPELRDTVKSAQPSSLSDVQRALSFFERPGRQAIIAGVAQRALEAMSSAAAEVEFQRLREKTQRAPVAPDAPREDEARETPKARKPIARRTVLVAAAVTLVLLVAAAVGAVTWQAPQRPGSALKSVTSATLNTGRTWVAWASTALNGQPRPAQAAASPDVQTSVPNGAPRSSMARAGRSVSARQDTQSALGGSLRRRLSSVDGTVGTVIDATGTNKANESAAGHTGAEWRPSENPATNDASMVDATAETAAEAGAVYSDKDINVVPPVMVRPQLPSEQARPADAGSLDILVNERGTVDQVRLLSPSNRFQDRMLVAAAKAWRFHVATRDGRPVKYRLRITIAP